MGALSDNVTKVAPRIAHNLQLEAELKTICKALGEAGIPFIVLKGAPLARRAFGNLSKRSRYQCDNDILVKQRDFVGALDALANVGYQPRSYRALPSKMDVEFQLPLFRRTDQGTLVAELHWAAFPPLLYPVEEELLWQNSEPFVLSGVPMRVFNPTLTVLHLAAHFVQHNGAGIWILEDFSAAWRTWSSEIELDELMDVARKLCLDHALAYTTMVAGNLGMLPAHVPRIRTARAELLLQCLPPERARDTDTHRRYARHLLMMLLVKPEHVPRWLYYQAFPPIELMSAIYQRPVTRDLYTRYISRLFRPALRKLKGLKETA